MGILKGAEIRLLPQHEMLTDGRVGSLAPIFASPGDVRLPPVSDEIGDVPGGPFSVPGATIRTTANNIPIR